MMELFWMMGWPVVTLLTLRFPYTFDTILLYTDRREFNLKLLDVSMRLIVYLSVCPVCQIVFLLSIVKHDSL